MPDVAGRIVGILLAAGRGVRFDPSGMQSKLLEPATRGPHLGAPLAVAAARTLRADVDDLIAVVAPATDEPTRRLHGCLRSEGCRLVFNPRAAEGQASSIKAGVAATDDAAGWIIALADMPAIPPGAASRIAQALRGGALSAAPTFRGRRGHPVGFAAALLPELVALAGDTGARAVLARHPPHCFDVDDAGVLYDVDTRRDLE